MLLLWHLLCKNGIAIKQLDADEKESLHNVITAHDRKWSLDIFGMFGLHIFAAWSQVSFVGTTCVKSKQIWASCRIQRGHNKGAVSFPQELRSSGLENVRSLLVSTRQHWEGRGLAGYEPIRSQDLWHVDQSEKAQSRKEMELTLSWEYWETLLCIKY